MPQKMLAVTLWQPWAWAITDLPEDVAKRLENRDWKLPDRHRGRLLAIHAGASYDLDGADSIECRLGVTIPRLDVPHKAVVGVVRYLGYVTESADPWFVGRYGWMLGDVVKLRTPVFCRGKQGLWTLPTHVHQAVWGQLAASSP